MYASAIPIAIITFVDESTTDELIAYFGNESASILGNTTSMNLPIAMMRLFPVRKPMVIRSLPVCPIR